MLLQGQLRWFVGTQDRKRRHDSLRCAQTVRDSETSGYPDLCEMRSRRRYQKKMIQ
jgi:hypothetical protein